MKPAYNLLFVSKWMLQSHNSSSWCIGTNWPELYKKRWAGPTTGLSQLSFSQHNSTQSLSNTQNLEVFKFLWHPPKSAVSYSHKCLLQPVQLSAPLPAKSVVGATDIPPPSLWKQPVSSRSHNLCNWLWIRHISKNRVFTEAVPQGTVP